MLIGLSLMVIIILGFFSTIIGNQYIGVIVNVGIDNEAFVNGSIVTYVVDDTSVLFEIDTSVFIDAGIVLIVAVLIVATVTGIQVLGSGLTSESVRVIVLITGFTGIWFALTTICINLIQNIQIFGSIIYIGLTLMYVVGVIQRLTGGT